MNAWRPLRAGAGTLLALALAPAPSAMSAEVSGSVALVSDYVFRGVSQSDGAPALQASLDVAWPQGWTLGAFASTVDFGPGVPADVELDLVAGWSHGAGERWVIDLGLAGYLYPGARPSGALDYAELLVTATRGNRLVLSAGWSDDALAAGGSGTYLAAGLRFALRRGWTLEATLGHSIIPVLAHDGYSHVQVLARREWAHAALVLAADATPDDARDEFGDAVGARLSAGVEWTLP